MLLLVRQNGPSRLLSQHATKQTKPNLFDRHGGIYSMMELNIDFIDKGIQTTRINSWGSPVKKDFVILFGIPGSQYITVDCLI